jgi:hypothetical protein
MQRLDAYLESFLAGEWFESAYSLYGPTVSKTNPLLTV